jgi:hypothetical protein
LTLAVKLCASNVMSSWCAHLAKGDFKYGHTCYVHTVRVNSNKCNGYDNEMGV